jgi:hypothetical protein
VKYLLTILFFLFTVQANAQDTLNFPPPAVPPEVRAMETTSPIAIDGRLTEAAWQIATPIARFFRIEPRQGGDYRHRTEVRLLFDKKNLYLGVFCRDTAGKKGLRLQDLRRDFLFGENENFFVAIDAQNTKRYCMVFNTTPLGNQRDLQVFDDSYRDVDWDALWKVRTQVTDSGWYAEYAIPFVTLRYDKPAGDSVQWGISFSRLARRDYEQTAFPAVPQAFSPQRMTYAARLTGLRLPKPSLNLRLQPYTLYQRSFNRNEAGRKTSEGQLKAGGEIKWAVNPHAVLDLTFNTDFAQADVDRVVNNLSRFNILFPERRQFFLENSGIWAGADFFGTKPFFSRRIGLDNSGGFNAEPVRIHGGVRYTDRTQSRTLAALYMRQEGGAAIGASNFAAARYLKNLGRQNNLGAMITHRLDETDAAKGFRQRNNTTVTLDGLFRPRDDVTLQFLVSGARNNTNDSLGTMGTIYAEYKPNKWFLQYWTKWVSKKYNPGMGFVFGNDVVYHKGGGYYIWRPKKWNWMRRWDPGVFVNYYHTASTGRLQQYDVDIFPVWIFFKDNSKLTWDIFFNRQVIDFDFAPLSMPIARGDYRYVRNLITYSSDASRKLSASLSYEGGGYYNGRLHTLTGWLRFAPLPQASLRADYSRSRFQGVGSRSINANVDLYSVELRLAYNPRIQASVFYQYNSFNQQGRWNARGSWEFAPLSFLYIVFNEISFSNSLLRNQSVINKISYLKQF